MVILTLAGVLAWAETPCPGQGGSFSVHIHVANNETNADTGIACAVLNVQRMGKRESSSQTNFSTQFVWRHQIYRRVEGKEKDLKRVGGIFMNYPRTGVWFGPGNDAILLSIPCMSFLDCCHRNCQLSWRLWLCRLEANTTERGDWWATVHGVAKNWTQLSN